MPEVLVGLFDAWLQDREARVVVGGQRNDPMILQNIIYKWTAWGPWLRNIFVFCIYGNTACINLKIGNDELS